QKLVDLDVQLDAFEGQVMQELWVAEYTDPNKVADRKRGDNAYKAWRAKSQTDCGLPANGFPGPLQRWGTELVKTDTIYNCMMEATQKRIAIYQKFHDELAAKNVSAATWAATGVRDAQ